MTSSPITAAQRWSFASLVAGVSVGLVWSAITPQPMTLELAHVSLSPLGVSNWRGVVTSLVMAVFFLSVGAEIGHEITQGALRHARIRGAVFLVAAFGMAVPALLMVTTGSLFGVHQVVSAWGVPMSTDVALVSALLALVAPSRSGLRVTMLAIAIADDALGIIVLAFSHHVEWRVSFLFAGVVGLFLTHVATRQHLRRISMAVAFAAAVLLIHGGLAASLTFVAAGVTLTSRGVGLDNMERVCAYLSTWIALPLFGLVVGTINWPTHPLRGNLAVCLSLFAIRLLGKASGLLLGAWCARRVNWHLPVRLVRRDLVALSILAAMGVTIPLYFAESAFPVTSPTYSAVDLTLLATTIVSAALGAMMLRRSNYEPSPTGQLTPVPPSPQ